MDIQATKKSLFSLSPSSSSSTPFYFLFYSPSLSLTLNQEYILDIIPCKIFIKVSMIYIKRIIMSGDYPL
jgi:hypothetical protein